MKSKTHVNAVFSLLQVVISSIVIFIAYKYLISELGVVKLGVWSLLAASVSVINVGSLGLSATLVKYVAKYLVSNNHEKISSIIQTALLTVIITSILLLVIVFILANILLKAIVPEDQIVLATNLLPYSLLNVGILLPAGISLSAIDGAQKIYKRNLLLISSAILFLVLVFTLVPHFDLLGVVYAQIFQSLFTLVVGWYILKGVFSFLPAIPYRWNLKAFREIIGYGTNLQLITIFQMLYEPVTKSFLTHFGGLASVGYYEMANRVVLKVREMIVSIFQVLVPVYATQIEQNIENIKSTYSKSLNYLLFLAIPLFSFLILATPILSIFWIGTFESQFYMFSIILICAWFINIFNTPAYFAFLGIGILRWNVVSHITIGILNLALCYILGSIYGGIGVVVGWALSLTIGSLIISFKFNGAQNINLYKIISKENKILFLVTAFILTSIGLIIYLFGYLSYNLIANTFFILVFILISFYFVWNNPIRRDLYNSIKILFSSK